MNKENIYSDGTYIKQHPSIHAEDSAYKMSYIAALLKEVEWERREVRILDIGGGAGKLGRLVCDWFSERGHSVCASALDVADDMISVQKANNPYLTNCHVGDIEVLGEEKFDLVLMIDVIEHIDDCERFADMLNRHAAYVVYNIPTEINLVDKLRNFATRGRYYPLQTESLGHVHFFSARSASRFVSRHHQKIKTIFAEYALYVLTSPHPDYARQRARFSRRLELVLSSAIQKLLPPLAPCIVQGSLFCLAKTKPQ